MQLPIYPDRPVARPVSSVTDNASGYRDASKQPSPHYVYRGELLEGVGNDRRYRPQPNLQVDPQNRRAIDTYHSKSYPILRYWDAYWTDLSDIPVIPAVAGLPN